MEGSASEEAAKYADLDDGVSMAAKPGDEAEGDDELIVVNARRNGSAGSKAGPEDDSKATGAETGAEKAAVTKQRSSSGSSPETDATMLRAEEKGSSSSSAGVGGGDKGGSESGAAAAGGLGKTSTLTALKPLGGGGIGGGARLTALPHHVPKMDSLASKLEDIRKNLGDEVSCVPLLCCSPQRVSVGNASRSIRSVDACLDTDSSPLRAFPCPLFSVLCT